MKAIAIGLVIKAMLLSYGLIWLGFSVRRDNDD